MTEEQKQVAAPSAEPADAKAKPGTTRKPVKRPGVPSAAAAAARTKVPAKKTASVAKAAPGDKGAKAAAPGAAEQTAKAKSVKSDKAGKAETSGKPAKTGKAEKPAKPPKVRKTKLIRDSYAMPDAEYARISELKKRLAALGSEVKKSELLRGGIALLTALSDPELKAVMARVERIKTGRPAKK